MAKTLRRGLASKRKQTDRDRSRGYSARLLKRGACTAAAASLAMVAGPIPPSCAMGILSHGYLQHNLVSDDTSKIPADIQDTSLVNPWGNAFQPGAAFWINDNGTGISALYFGNGASPGGANTALAVTVPGPPGGSPPSTPTGIVANSSGTFKVKKNNAAAAFIFATEDGTISAWNGALGFPGPAELEVDNSAATCPNGSTGSVYKGLAQGATTAGLFILRDEFFLRHS